jgi:hypothetical protein
MATKLSRSVAQGLADHLYVFRFQEDDSRKSWLRRWEYRREPPDADYPYSLGHLHVRGTSPDGAAIDREHNPAPQMPLEEVIRYLIADRGVKPKNKGWKAILEESEKTFHS